MLLEGQRGSESPKTLIPSKLIIVTKIVATLFETLPLMDHFGFIILSVLTMAL